MCPIPQPRLVVGEDTTYIFFSNISWTPWVLDPITYPYLGPPLGCTLLQSLLCHSISLSWTNSIITWICYEFSYLKNIQTNKLFSLYPHRLLFKRKTLQRLCIFTSIFTLSLTYFNIDACHILQISSPRSLMASLLVSVIYCHQCLTWSSKCIWGNIFLLPPWYFLFFCLPGWHTPPSCPIGWSYSNALLIPLFVPNLILLPKSSPYANPFYLHWWQFQRSFSYSALA